MSWQMPEVFIGEVVLYYEGKNKEGGDLLRQLASDYSYTEWGRRAAARLRTMR